MSSFTQSWMTNHHELRLLSQLRETVTIWRRRARERRELAAWSDRDMSDAGVSTCDAAHEMGKPFWRA